MKTQTWKHLAIALVGSVALGAGTGCASFWAASAPESSSNQEMEEATPIEDTSAEDEEDAEAAETDTDQAASGGMDTDGSETGGMADDSGATETGGMGSGSKMTGMKKMTLSSMGAQSATADLYWDVAENKAMGKKELKLQLVDAGSGAELKACREIKVSADQKSFMGKRVGIEVEERTERLTTYLPQDALDKLAAANTVTVFVCEYKFLLGPNQQSKLGELRDADSNGSGSTGVKGGTDTGMGSDTGAEGTGTTGGTGSEGTGTTGTTGSGSDY